MDYVAFLSFAPRSQWLSEMLPWHAAPAGNTPMV